MKDTDLAKKTSNGKQTLSALASDLVFGMVLGTAVRAIIDNSDDTPNEKAIPAVLQTIVDSASLGFGATMGKYLATKSWEKSVSSGAMAASGSVIGHALYYLIKYN
ncbi:MAG TPA: hypothetical protein VJH68_01180 [Candidatus Nanoarchaeia archaeon]|nr:hypothetical protein [Candidatus Nanoarchaeia archaeon]